MKLKLARLYALWKISGKEADRLRILESLRPLVATFKDLDWWDARHVSGTVRMLGADARELLPAIDRALGIELDSDDRKNLVDARQAIIIGK